MMENVNGLSLDLLVHPGETIKEILDDKNMSQEELAIRTGYSPKHISEVVRGKKDISSEFANALEYAFGISSNFWMNLQNNYNKKVIEIKNLNSIQKEEFDILKQLNEVVKYCENTNIIETSSKKEITILSLRRLLNVNNLASISNLAIPQAAFRGSKKIKTNIYVLYAWQKLCEISIRDINLSQKYDANKLKTKFEDIKSTMFLPAKKMIVELKKIFAECGIIFDVMKNFTGAPVQGFIQKKNEQVVLCMTIRQAFADIFWFTLFHEIGHLLNNDFNDQYIDYQFTDSEIEQNADLFAQNTLINNDDYQKFAKKEQHTDKEIIEFAKQQNVKPFIIVGRIQSELNDYTYKSKFKDRYIWG